MFNGSRRWLNVEKGAFLAASLVLLLAAFRFLDAPQTCRWNSPRCDTFSIQVPGTIRGSGSLDGYLAGERGNPFGQAGEAHGAQGDGAGEAVAALGEGEPKPAGSGGGGVIPDSGVGVGEEGGGAGVLSEQEQSVHVPSIEVVGRLRVGESPRCVFFRVDGSLNQCVAVREGQPLPGTGARFVGIDGDVVTVEGEDGQRHVLTDLLMPRTGGAKEAPSP